MHACRSTLEDPTAQAANSALLGARLRFVEGLPARAHELSSTAERLARDPQATEIATQLRQRLDALRANAQLFDERALSLALSELIARLDAAERDGRTFSSEEIDAVIVVVASLPTYVRPSLPPPPIYSDVRELRAEPLSTAEPEALRDDDAPPSFALSLDQQAAARHAVPGSGSESLRADPEGGPEVRRSAELERGSMPPWAASAAGDAPTITDGLAQPSAGAAPGASLGPIDGSAPPSATRAAPGAPFGPIDGSAPPSAARAAADPSLWAVEGSAPPSAADAARAPAQSTSESLLSATPGASPLGSAGDTSQASPGVSAEPEVHAHDPRRQSGILSHAPAAGGGGPAAPQVGRGTHSSRVRATPPTRLERSFEDAPERVVLLVDANARGARLPVSGCELVEAGSADEAVRLLHELAPDLVLVSAELASAPDADLVRRLKTDPLAPVASVYLLLGEGATHDAAFLQQIGADGVLREPLDPTALAQLFPLAQPELPAPKSEARPGSVDEIAAQIAEEIRRGIAESLRAEEAGQPPRSAGPELMAAARSALGRMRPRLGDGSDLLRASQPPMLGSSGLGLDGALPGVHPSQLLAGCRVLVADDDPAVLWFFAGLLREAGAHVLQAHDGREALELARRKLPHAIVSDILMPKLDGFGLCRERKRDALLAHVPVVLLSWKDDLLQRMRELDAGAAGYLRKEAGSQQVLKVLHEVLRPRTQLVAKLRGRAEVHGDLNELGVFSLLELVAAERPDARILLRDAWHLFEVEIRGGRRLSVTRTAADGTFTRGEQALLQLVGLAAGQYEVSHGAATLRGPLTEPFDRALWAAGRRLSALLDAVSDARLLKVSLIAFDDDALRSLLAEPSSRLHEVVALFRTGNATAESLLREGRFAPGELEDCLRELARSVAITGVWDAAGDDLVAAAQRERELPQLVLLTASVPPRTGSWPLAAAAPREPGAALPARTRLPDAAPASIPLSPSSSAPEPAATPALQLPATATPSAGAADTLPDLPPLAASTHGTAPGVGPALRAVQLEDARGFVPAAVERGSRSAADAPATGVAALPESGAPDAVLESSPGAGVAEPELAEDPRADAVTAAELAELEQPLAAARRERAEGLRLLATVVTLVAVGYFGWQHLVMRRQNAPASPPPAAGATQLRPAEPAPAGSTSALPSLQLGRVLPFVDASRGVPVAEGEGLLVVEHTGSEPAPNVRVGSRELGRPPLAIALPAGRHELVLRAGKNTSFRYLVIRAGQTRIVSVPLAAL